MAVFCSWGLTKEKSDAGLQLRNPSKSLSSDLPFEDRESPEIAGREIWAVGRVLQGVKVVLVQVQSSISSSMGGGVVHVQYEVLRLPQLRAFPPDRFSQLPQNRHKVLRSNCFSFRKEVDVHWSLTVKKKDQHSLSQCTSLSSFHGVWLIIPQPVHGLLLHFWLVDRHPTFICGDQSVQQSWIFLGSDDVLHTQFTPDSALIFCEDMRYEDLTTYSGTLHVQRVWQQSWVVDVRQYLTS